MYGTIKTLYFNYPAAPRPDTQRAPPHSPRRVCRQRRHCQMMSQPPCRRCHRHPGRSARTAPHAGRLPVARLRCCLAVGLQQSEDLHSSHPRSIGICRTARSAPWHTPRICVRGSHWSWTPSTHMAHCIRSWEPRHQCLRSHRHLSSLRRCETRHSVGGRSVGGVELRFRRRWAGVGQAWVELHTSCGNRRTVRRSTSLRHWA